MILSHLLSTGKEEDLVIIHPLIEQETVHPHLEIRPILEKAHPLFSSSCPQRGLFAREKIPSGTDLGSYAGRISLKSADWKFEEGNYDYCLVIPLGRYYYIVDGRKWANEMAFINDYRGIAKEPNICASTVVHRGCYYPMLSTLRTIFPGEELLWDYGKGYTWG
jgi:SET domain-containing protein